eukprot:SAG31_NODE_4513_length_3176_cov_1.782255_1_plen_88_part_00
MWSACGHSNRELATMSCDATQINPLSFGRKKNLRPGRAMIQCFGEWDWHGAILYFKKSANLGHSIAGNIGWHWRHEHGWDARKYEHE